MREILFRGKIVETCKWVNGDLDTMNYAPNPKSGAKLGISDGYETFDVLAETVGQYTGLTDKKGKRIFEGDILKLTQKYDENIYIAAVKFGNPNSDYSWGWQLIFKEPFHLNSDILCWIGVEDGGAYCEIIGNIHDNPKILENDNENK